MMCFLKKCTLFRAHYTVNPVNVLRFTPDCGVVEMLKDCDEVLICEPNQNLWHMLRKMRRIGGSRFMGISRVDTVSIPVSDQSLALAFYRDALGFELIRDHLADNHRRWIQLAPKGAETTISLVMPFGGMTPGSVQGLVVQTDDIHATHHELSSRGVPLSEIVTIIGGRFATFADPDGNGWVLIEATTQMLA